MDLGIFAVVVGGVENGLGLGLGLVAGGWQGWRLCWLAKQWCCVVVVAAAVVGVRRLGFKIWGFLIFFFNGGFGMEGYEVFGKAVRFA